MPQGYNRFYFMAQIQVNLHQLISFFLVAREKSFSRASEQLSITQPAITQHIHALEAQFGVKLVNLKKKRVFLTKAGDRLLPYAEDLFNQAVMADNFLKSYRFNNLSLGVAGQLMLYFTPLIDKFKELHPSTRVSIREAPSFTLVEELLDFRHDVCLTGPTPTPYNERLRVYRIPRDEPMIFVASPECPIGFDKPVAWAHLAALPLILQSKGSASRALVLHHFKKRGLIPLIGAEVDNIEFAKQLARQKKGIVFMFEPNVREEIIRGALKIILVEDDDVKTGPTEVLVNRESLTPATEAFLALIKQHFRGSLHEVPPE